MSAYRGVYFDSGAYIALADGGDTNHPAAVACLSDLGAETQRVTSWGVIAEVYTWLRYHLAPPQSAAWLRAIEQTQARGVTRVVYPDAALDALSRRKLARFDDQRISYVDALSLAILETDAALDAVFAFDRHMGLAGLRVLPLGLQR